MLKFQASIDGVRNVTLGLDETEHKIFDIPRVLESAAKKYQEAFLENWQTNGSLTDTPWPALSAQRIDRKERRGLPEPSKPLMAEGDLLSSLRGAGRYALKRISDSEAVIGTSHPDAHWHEDGGIRTDDDEVPPRTRMIPRRPMVSLRKDVHQALFRSLVNEIDGLGRDVWGQGWQTR